MSFILRIRRFGGAVVKQSGAWRQILLGLCLWLCFIKLPALALRDSAPQSWEAVLYFGAAHHLVWGKDIVFTYGPLAFLVSDFYWGNFFGQILFWALGFALITTIAFLRFAKRITPALRVPLYLGVALVTVPASADLGFDPIYFFSITLLGLGCLPDERPSQLQLTVTAVVFSILSCIKFTFALYGGFTLAVIVVMNWLCGRRRNVVTLLAGGIGGLGVACWWSSQSPSSILLHFWRSFQMAAGYSSAMAGSAERSDLFLGLLLLCCVSVLVLWHWLRTKDRVRQTGSVIIAAAGIFLTWKEGFVRPDEHVIVFLVYSLLLAAMLPALLGQSRSAEIAQGNEDGHGVNSAAPLSIVLPRPLMLFTAATLLVAVAPFALHRKDFVVAVRTGFGPKLSETIEAFFAPATFKHELDQRLDAMRKKSELPQIRAQVAQSRVGVLSYDQDVAILNRLNYIPHPIFQNYAAYTPGFQRLNAVFFDSPQAPEYVIWRLNTIDVRFPTLDDGTLILKMLAAYSPVLQERGFVLWQRRTVQQDSCSLGERNESSVALNQWLPIPSEPTWLRVEMRKTWWGEVQSFLWSSSDAQIEVQLTSGLKLHYLLPPGLARAGFVLNPLLQSDADLTGVSSQSRAPSRVSAIRIYSSNKYFFARQIRVVAQIIYGIPGLQDRPGAAKPDVTLIRE